MSTSTTAYLSDGRHIDVPHASVMDWQQAVTDFDTTLGLADWYTEQGDEHTEDIQGAADDEPKCEHLLEARDQRSVRVTNASQAEGYDRTLPHASAWICTRPECILDGLAWITRATGEPGVWIDASTPEGSVHTLPVRYETVTEPIEIEDARAMALDEHGRATVLVALDKYEFYRFIEQQDEQSFVVEDGIHPIAFAFGSAFESSADAIAIDGDTIVVRYTTNVAQAILDEEEANMLDFTVEPG